MTNVLKDRKEGQIYLLAFVCSLGGRLGIYEIVPKILSEHLRGFPVIDGVGGSERVPPFLLQTQNLCHPSVRTVSLHLQ